MAAAQVDLARKVAAVAAVAAASASILKTALEKSTTTADTKTKIKTIGGPTISREERRRRRRGRPSLKKETNNNSTDLAVVSNCGQTSLMAKIQDLSRRYPLPKYRPELLSFSSSKNLDQNKTDHEVQPKVKLEARTCVLTDASLLRRYLIEDRQSEAPPGEAKYDLADIVWVKVRGQPWWPAMISVHPQRDCYLKYRSSKFFLEGFYFCFCLPFRIFSSFSPSEDYLAYHVQTFAVIHHGWVSERDIRGRFQGWEHFEADMLRRITACRLPAELEKTWKSFSGGGLREKKISFSLAVAEAAEACRLTKAERLSTLTYRYYSKRYGKFFET